MNFGSGVVCRRLRTLGHCAHRTCRSGWLAIGMLLPAAMALPLVSVASTAADDVRRTHTEPVSNDRPASLESRWMQAIASDTLESFSSLLAESRLMQATAAADASQAPARLASLTDRAGRTALMVACKHGELRLARELVELGADVQARTLTGGSPFMFAALGNQQSIARWLLEQGADAQLAGSNGWTASMIAAAKGFSTLLEWLISVGADVDRPDVYGFTPLMRAVDNQHAEAAAVLLSSVGLDIDAQDETGNTALHHAVAGGSPGLVRQLLQHHASVDLANREGQTASVLASGQPAIEALLQR